ncbi:MAG: hypothetical protein AAF991_04260 [Pseudomonadota bacterium]
MSLLRARSARVIAEEIAEDPARRTERKEKEVEVEIEVKKKD